MISRSFIGGSVSMIGAMPLLSRQRGPIALYGATGYTGRLTAAELKRLGAEFVISGRNREKLESLRDELGGDVPVRPASLDDREELRALLSDCSAVIDCAGPFTLHGEPVLRAAVDTETHYLDTTGEQTYMKLGFETYGPLAERAGTVVIPAMGFDYVPGDMLAALTAEGMGEVDEVTLAYAPSGFKATRGTALSAIEIFKGGSVEWRKLQWLPAPGGLATSSFDFGEPLGRRKMASYPAGEQITVPRHIPTRRVRTLLTLATVAPGPFGTVAGLLSRPTQLALRTPLRKALGAAISRLPEGPDPEERAAARFTIVCEVTRGRTKRRGVVTGRDVYGLTAAAVAEGAITAARGGISSAGALAPSQAFAPAGFLGKLDRFDVAWSLQEPTEVNEPVPAT
jgi:short subunit dehydrogenase-like uncharacterized protein